jgi:hypothetical protein
MNAFFPLFFYALRILNEIRQHGILSLFSTNNQYISNEPNDFAFKHFKQKLLRLVSLSY